MRSKTTKRRSKEQNIRKQQPPHSLEQNIEALIKTHAQCMELTEKAMKTVKELIEVAEAKIGEAKKLKEELQASYDKRLELKQLPLRGVV